MENEESKDKKMLIFSGGVMDGAKIEMGNGLITGFNFHITMYENVDVTRPTNQIAKVKRSVYKWNKVTKQFELS